MCKIGVQPLINVENLVVPLMLLGCWVLDGSFGQNGIILGKFFPVLVISQYQDHSYKQELVTTYLWTFASEAHNLNIPINLFGRPFQVFVHHPTILPLSRYLNNFILPRLFVLPMELQNLRMQASWRSPLVLRILCVCPSSVIRRLLDSDLKTI